MAKKAISAMLLISMMAWAEMALAPMLAMHAGHMRPGHEMAADMPSDRSAHNHAAMHHATADAKPAQMDPAQPCCPGIHQAEPQLVLELRAGTSGCDDPHSCCFQQGPQSIPAPARDVQKLTRDMAPAVVAEAKPAQPAVHGAVGNSTLVLSPPPGVFGMIIRV